MNLFEIAYFTYVFLCTLLLPLRMLAKRKRLRLSLVLLFIPVLLGYLPYSYLLGSSNDEDHGIAVAGLFLTVPLLSFVCQLVVFSVANVVVVRKGIENEHVESRL